MEYEIRKLLKLAISNETKAKLKREQKVIQIDNHYINSKRYRDTHRAKHREAILAKDRSRKRKQRPKAS